MSLEKKIDKDLIMALKSKDELKVNTLRFLKAAIKNFAIEKKAKELKDEDIIQVIRKQTKQRQEAISAYEKGNRLDLAEKEKKEFEILKSYMPQDLSEDELKKIISEAINETAAKTIKEMGKVMSVVMPKVAGRAEGKLVSKLVVEELKKAGEAEASKEEQGNS
jgi:hypothetical protein